MFAHRKSYAGNPMVVLDLSYNLSFKVIYDFVGQIYTNHAVSSLSLHVEFGDVMFVYRNSYTRNLMVVLVLTYDLSFKVICDSEGHIYTNHAISSLLFHVEVWVVMFAYRKPYIRNLMVVLDLSYDLSFKVICDFEGQQIISCTCLYVHLLIITCKARDAKFYL